MPEANQELGPAVEAVLEWLGTSPEAAAAALGINAGTLNAMLRGVVPMRSLVIRFAEGIARRCGERPGAQDWWTDVDAWLAHAGYQARREAGAPSAHPSDPPLPEPPPERGFRDRSAAPAPPPDAQHPTPESPTAEDPLAAECFRPVYERQPWGGTFVHVFWIEDRAGKRVFRRHMNLQVDYKAEAGRLKHDLATLPRSAFERKYGRFRVQEPE